MSCFSYTPLSLDCALECWHLLSVHPFEFFLLLLPSKNILPNLTGLYLVLSSSFFFFYIHLFIFSFPSFFFRAKSDLVLASPVISLCFPGRSWEKRLWPFKSLHILTSKIHWPALPGKTFFFSLKNARTKKYIYYIYTFTSSFFPPPEPL